MLCHSYHPLYSILIIELYDNPITKRSIPANHPLNWSSQSKELDGFTEISDYERY